MGKKNITLAFYVFALIIITLSSFFLITRKNTIEKIPDTSATIWQLQSIDTMKYSRDLAREKVDDGEFNTVIDEQMSQIADTGATHVAIGTPYDEEFRPFLAKWVASARKYNLKVWFRGNWAGWEGWFDYEPITIEEHTAKTQEFILNNPGLFRDGDIFTSCTECENGQDIDPRKTGDVDGYRTFLTDEYSLTKAAFQRIDKDVAANYYSMNGDIARLIMDRETTRKLDGIVVIDHYVRDPEKLNNDVTEIALASGGKVVLGEFGAPIPDIHGNLSEKEQAEWIDNALLLLLDNPHLLGINYWVNRGGSTQLWNETGSPRTAAQTLTTYFSPKTYNGRVIDTDEKGVVNARVTYKNRTVYSDSEGKFSIAYVKTIGSLTIEAEGYTSRIVDPQFYNTDKIRLEYSDTTIFHKIERLFRNLTSF